MKSAFFALTCLVVCAPAAAYAGEQLIPAGALIQCTISEPRLSSKTADIGDPVLCQAGYTGRYTQFTLPYGSYLVGRFEDYKDPGHFVGKGWMELDFDHVVIEPDTVIPLHAKVVDVPGYNIDRRGRILGRGHAVRDTVEWLLPVLWPIDLINLPRRGPRPTLKSETQITLKVMNDVAVPAAEPFTQESPGLLRRRPSAYEAPQPAPPPEPSEAMAAPSPAPVAAPPPVATAPPAYYAAPAPVYYAVPARPVYVPVAPPPPPYYAGGAYYVPPRPVYVAPHAQAWAPRMMVVYRNGMAYSVYAP